MFAIQAWLRRADPETPALVLPDAAVLNYGDLASLTGRPGLQVLEGSAATLARGLAASALGRGTALPLAPGLAAGPRRRLIGLAEAAANPRLALIIATSGSTGTPRGVRLPWRALAAAARMGNRVLGLQPGDTWLACLPLFHVGGAMILYRCWRAGATALVHEGFAADAVLRDLHECRVTHVSLVPPMLAQLLDAGPIGQTRPPPTLRHVLVGGAALNEPLLARALAAGWPVATTWGMTETCAMATLAGRPLPGVRVRAAASGVLEIATPAHMAGYLGELDAGEWFATSDLGTVDAEGCVRITGRADDMLISGGVNVHPQEVESRLAACPGIREAGVAGIRDPVWGDVIAAVYEGEVHEEVVESWCRAHLPGPRRPRRFLRVERLPRTASGKLDRRSLASLVRR